MLAQQCTRLVSLQACFALACLAMVPATLTCKRFDNDPVIEYDCRHLQLATFPADVPSDTNWLSLSYNLLTRINFGDLINFPLMRLDLDNNPQLSFIDVEAFANMSLLETLYIQNCAISDFQNGIFDNVPSLTRLWLDNNKLTTIGRYMFSDLTSVNDLRLNNNIITSIENGAFSSLTLIQKLQLFGNEISSFSTGAFEGLSANQTYPFLYLYANTPVLHCLPANTGIANMPATTLIHLGAKPNGEEYTPDKVPICH